VPQPRAFSRLAADVAVRGPHARKPRIRLHSAMELLAIDLLGLRRRRSMNADAAMTEWRGRRARSRSRSSTGAKESMVRGMRSVAAVGILGLFVQACCACPQPAAGADNVDAAAAEPVAPAEPSEVTAPAAAPAAAAPAAQPSKEEPKPAKPAVAEPQFTDGMSVADAIKAVPQGAERANIDQETLSMPIQDVNVYEPCKPGAAHIKMKIAVWDGKAVGLDITSTPKNDKLVACIKEQIQKLSWKAHVKSLNTVEYSF
jgi:hypothetical protein